VEGKQNPLFAMRPVIKSTFVSDTSQLKSRKKLRKNDLLEAGTGTTNLLRFQGA